jgi:hypothetical protein
MRKITILIIALIIINIGFFSGCNEETKEKSNPMKIHYFYVSHTQIESGETANLSWNVTGATTVSIDNNIGTVSLNGSIIIQPTQNTTYTMTAINVTDSVTATAEIIVEDITPTDDIPEIRFFMDQEDIQLIVTSVSESGLNWDDIQITGRATKPTGTIEMGDLITDCVGTITISWKGTSSLGTWYFTEENATLPNIYFSKLSDKIIVWFTDPGLDWNDFIVFYDGLTLVLFNTEIGTNIPNGYEVADEGTIVKVEDYIYVEGAGTLRLIHKPTNLIIKIWIFN